MITTKISGRFSRLLLRSAHLQQMFEQEMRRKRRNNLRLMRLNALRLKVQECIYQLAVQPAPALVRCRSATR